MFLANTVEEIKQFILKSGILTLTKQIFYFYISSFSEKARMRVLVSTIIIVIPSLAARKLCFCFCFFINKFPSTIKSSFNSRNNEM